MPSGGEPVGEAEAARGARFSTFAITSPAPDQTFTGGEPVRA